ncbi:peptidase S10 [Bosea sp. F3-2]|uniref:S10 family peptidase n=1 Tax=Bosea sp. F3-2 TaxID=2599640 RepID=UPI0011F04AE7|nr:peptidase S10 [Bosea sp. F3-2]QEL24904.1 peptidase S10 [Bosea sp. F3-2]
MDAFATTLSANIDSGARERKTAPCARSWQPTIALLLTLLGPAYADAQEGAAKDQISGAKPAPEATERRIVISASLPAPSVTRHEIALADGPLQYTATAGALPVRELSGRVLGEIAYIAYQRISAGEKADQRRRPVVFAFNGGPGAASAYLNVGAFGPKRVAFGRPGDAPSAPPNLVDNQETWLNFTDLVFIDPVGTGFSHFAPGVDDARGTLWSVGGDYRSLSRFIVNWLRANDRIGSPVYLAGESYGGFRAPKIAGELQTSDGVGVSGLILISPVLDFTFQRDARDTPLKWAVTLPSLAATHLEATRGFSPDRLAEAEAYAAGEYLTDLMKGPRDPQARARIIERVSTLTGLDRDLVERRGGKIDSGTFLREAGRKELAVGSPYDGAVAALDPEPDAARSQAPDAVLEAATAPLTSAMLNHYSNDLKWSPDGRYMLLNSEVSRRWNYGSGRGDRESISELRKLLALDPHVRVLVAHGYSDLVSPYLESKLLLDQLPALGDPRRVKLSLFEGGHMFYSRETSRAGLRDAARQIVEPRQGL